jgi:hypothetical protein
VAERHGQGGGVAGVDGKGGRKPAAVAQPASTSGPVGRGVADFVGLRGLVLGEMQLNSGDHMNAEKECCPKFDPAPWQERWITLDGKMFVKDRVRSFLRLPLNFGGVMVRNMAAIQKAGAEAPGMLLLSDENSLWGADVYLEVTKAVPGAEMASISGTFLTQAYEGPYRGISKWIMDMKVKVAAKGKTLKKLYFYYTTCPKCAKKYGKNYVVLFAQV